MIHDDGLEYRCVVCLKPPVSVYTHQCRGCDGDGCAECGWEGVIEKEVGNSCSSKKHLLRVYPFRCEACGGNVRVWEGRLVGECLSTWDKVHQVEGNMRMTGGSNEHMPVPQPYNRMGKWNVKGGQRCERCNGRLAFRDGGTWCIRCLAGR